jgi:hypothetical protein
MLLCLLYVSQLQVGEGKAVHGLRVLGIDLEGLAQAQRVYNYIKK